MTGPTDDPAVQLSAAMTRLAHAMEGLAQGVTLVLLTTQRLAWMMGVVYVFLGLMAMGLGLSLWYGMLMHDEHRALLQALRPPP